jgi:hypothetical protein
MTVKELRQRRSELVEGIRATDKPRPGLEQELSDVNYQLMLATKLKRGQQLAG